MSENNNSREEDRRQLLDEAESQPGVKELMEIHEYSEEYARRVEAYLNQNQRRPRVISSTNTNR